MKTILKTNVSHGLFSNFWTLLKFWIPVAIFILGIQALQARTLVTEWPNLHTSVEKSLLSSQTLSRSNVADGLVIRAFGIEINFEDNRLNKNVETLIFKDGDYHELDRDVALPQELVDTFFVIPYCTVKFRKGVLYNGSIPDALWIDDAVEYQVNPYIPPSIRVQRQNEQLILTLDLKTDIKTSYTSAFMEQIVCHLSEDLIESSGGLFPLLEHVMGSWVRFEWRQ